MMITYAAVVALALGAPAAMDEPKNDKPELPVTLVLGPGQATATPIRAGSTHTGGGNIHVTQPSPDTISVTMTGVVVASGHPLKDSSAIISFDLSQCFEVEFHNPKLKKAKLILWGRTVGLVRSEGACLKKSGTAEIATPGRAGITCGSTEILSLTLPGRSACGGQNHSVADRAGPVWVDVGPGKHQLHQVFGLSALHEKSLFRTAAAAEFAPDPALESDWLGAREPFHGAAKKDFGFQIILRVVADDEPGDKNDKK